MKIKISTLPPSGLKFTEDLSVERLNERMAEGRGGSIVFTADPKVNLTITKKPNGAEANGTIKALYKQECGRCTKDVERALEVPVEVALKPRGPDEEHLEDDIGLVYFTDDHIELTDLLEELIILKLAFYWSPDLDLSKKCVVCGVKVVEKREDTTPKSTFGDLLKKAGVS